MDLTADEAEQYDRQIRLWGLEAQKRRVISTSDVIHYELCCRLRKSTVLVVGAKGLGAELCKNVVLAGVKSLTLLDHTPLSPDDLGCRFLGNTDGMNVRSFKDLHRHTYNVMWSHTACSAGCGSASSHQS